MKRVQVQSLVRELRYHVLLDTDKKQNKTKQNKNKNHKSTKIGIARVGHDLETKPPPPPPPPQKFEWIAL